MTQAELLTDIRDFLKAAREAGDIPKTSNNTSTVFLGMENLNRQIPMTDYPYIAIDDGGERTEVVSSTTQNRFYIVNLEFMVHELVGAVDYEESKSLIECLNFSNKIKEVLEREENRRLDGMTFGVNITPLLFGDEQGNAFRGRRVSIEYRDLEDRYFEF